jgi:uncharacterized membrane protein
MGWTIRIALHAACAVACLLLGSYQLLRRPKGDLRHRRIGWTWGAGMAFVATSSFAIRELQGGRLSLLHVLSVVTLISLLIGIRAARSGHITRHRASTRSSWLGLIGAFLGAVTVPDRRIPTFVITNPLGALTAASALALAVTGVIALA